MNPRGKGRIPKTSKEKDPWTTGVSCQQFFHSPPGHSYFRVDSKRPFSDRQTRPRMATAVEEEEENEDESEIHSKRSEALSDLSQGISLIFLYKIVVLTVYIEPRNWESEWSRLDSKILEFRTKEIRKIEKNRYDNPSPWLERTRWASYLDGPDRIELLALVGEPDTPLLKVIWASFDELARKSQQSLSNIGYFGRFQIVRTETNQFRAKPFRAYQDPSRIPMYSRSFK